MIELIYGRCALCRSGIQLIPAFLLAGIFHAHIGFLLDIIGALSQKRNKQSIVRAISVANFTAN